MYRQRPSSKSDLCPLQGHGKDFIAAPSEALARRPVKILRETWILLEIFLAQGSWVASEFADENYVDVFFVDFNKVLYEMPH